MIDYQYKTNDQWSIPLTESDIAQLIENESIIPSTHIKLNRAGELPAGKIGSLSKYFLRIERKKKKKTENQVEAIIDFVSSELWPCFFFVALPVFLLIFLETLFVWRMFFFDCLYCFGWSLLHISF